jgi:hypothetical protein
MYSKMLVKLGRPSETHSVLQKLCELILVVTRNPEHNIRPCYCHPTEIIAGAMRISPEPVIPSFRKEHAIGAGFIIMGTHSMNEPEIDLTLMISHMLAYHRKCRTIDALAEGNCVIATFIELIGNHMIPIE